MRRQKKFTLTNWGVDIPLLLLFLIWHGAFEGPLSSDEVERYLAQYQELHPKEDSSAFRRFLEEDDGRPVVMVNAIQLYDSPIAVNGKEYGDTSQQALSEYTGFVIPFLLRRGSYPIFSGNAVFGALEVWGIENAERWSSGALMRYRSRRVMSEMITNPVFAQFHDAKLASMEKTFAFPTTIVLATGSLTLVVFLGLLALALGIQLLIARFATGTKTDSGKP